MTPGETLRNAVSDAIVVFAEKSGLLKASDEACAAQTFAIMEVAAAHVKGRLAIFCYFLEVKRITYN